MNRYIVLFFVLITFPVLLSAKGEILNILTLGAKPDGRSDNWEIIQRAIDRMISAGGGTIYFPKGEYAIYNKSLVISGDNLVLVGESELETKIVKKGTAGYFGDCIDICGKIKGYKYFGDFGRGNYNALREYKGETIPARNIYLKNITFTTSLSKINSSANNLGILNSSDVTVESCTFTDAPQTNIAIINNSKQYKNNRIRFINCNFLNSGSHNVRVITSERGALSGNDVMFEGCVFGGVKGEERNFRDIIGRRINLWYRGAHESNKSFLCIKSCTFDKTGIVYLSANVSGFKMTGSIVRSNLEINHSIHFEDNPSINVAKNRFIATSTRDREAYQGIVIRPTSLSQGGNVRILNNQNF